MLSRVVLIAIALATGCAMPAIAGTADYAFEPVKLEVKKGENVTIGVRLVQKSTNKPVPDAIIAKSRMDMGPDGMPTMDAPLTAIPSSEPGIYFFKASLPMAGRWLLSVAAKVQGEPETVIGKIIYTVTP
jgi:hypothetical protein